MRKTVTTYVSHEVINVNLRATVGTSFTSLRRSFQRGNVGDQAVYVDFHNSRKTVRDLHKKQNAILT